MESENKYHRVLARFAPFGEDECMLICFPSWSSRMYHIVPIADLPDAVVQAATEARERGEYYRTCVHVTLGACDQTFDIDHETWEVS